MFDIFLVLFLPAIFGIVFIGGFIAVVVLAIVRFTHTIKKEVEERKLREFENINTETQLTENEPLKCEYCGSMVGCNDKECVSCGAKISKKK